MEAHAPQRAGGVAARIGIGKLDVVIDGGMPAALQQSGVARRVMPVPRPADGRPLGVITTTAAEERLWRRRGGQGNVEVAASLGDPERAREGAARLIRAGCGSLLSFGLASALAPAMRPGDIVVAEAVALPSRRTIRCDAAWRQASVARVRAAGLRVVEARVAGADEVPVLRVDRHRSFQATFAAAIDTESHAVAEAALAAGLPFLVIRAVVDSTDRPLIGVDGAERRGLFLLLSHLVTRPWRLPTVWRFARDCKAALGSLEQVSDLLPAPVDSAAA